MRALVWTGLVGMVGASVGLLAACIAVTGGTDGYVAAEASEDAATVSGACPADAAFCIALECLSTAECPASTDDAAPLICCLGEVNGNTLGSSCQAGCSLGVQACSTSAECVSGSCILQQCPGTTPITFRACGLAPTCSAIEGSSPDAGNPSVGKDAGGTDAGSTDAASSDANALDAESLDGGG